MTKLVQIIPQVAERKNKNGTARSEFWFDGSAYILDGNQTKAVRNEVADAWVAHDSNVRVVNDR
jgi:hypothetical protein